jgi:MOSC domain-containing protein YiiM
MFGENLTVAGLPLEDEMAVGDRLRVGSAEFLVSQPRLPCFKLGTRFDDARMVKRFLQVGRSGYYLRVVVEGDVGTGDEIEMLARPSTHVSVSEITRLYLHGHDDIEGLERALRVDALAESWRPYFEQLLEHAKP